MENVVAIIDYGTGNLRSVANMVKKLGCTPRITSDPVLVLGARAVILPGVGAAATAMESLAKTGMTEIIWQLVREKRPLLAICVGLQILFSRTEEGGWHECLGVLPGIVKKLPSGLKVPHLGWNQLKQRLAHPIFEGIPDEANFYFAHSFYAEPEYASLIAGTTEYSINFCSVVIKDNLIATQFHPEKSGEVGLKMCGNFLKMALSGQ